MRIGNLIRSDVGEAVHRAGRQPVQLEERGLVDRQLDEDDGQVSHLGLTAEGRRVLLGRSPRAVETARDAIEGGAGVDAALEQWLRALQRSNDQSSFGVCASCRFFERRGGSRHCCGLTQEPLTVRDSERIFREHEYPEGGRQRRARRGIGFTSPRGRIPRGAAPCPSQPALVGAPAGSRSANRPRAALSRP